MAFGIKGFGWRVDTWASSWGSNKGFGNLCTGVGASRRGHRCMRVRSLFLTWKSCNRQIEWTWHFPGHLCTIFQCTLPAAFPRIQNYTRIEIIPIFWIREKLPSSKNDCCTKSTHVCFLLTIKALLWRKSSDEQTANQGEHCVVCRSGLQRSKFHPAQRYRLLHFTQIISSIRLLPLLEPACPCAPLHRRVQTYKGW